MSLKNPFVCYEFFNKFLNFVEIEWEKKNEIIYPPSIPSFKWHYDYLFFEKKKNMENKVLDKLCENIVDVIYQTFTCTTWLKFISPKLVTFT